MASYNRVILVGNLCADVELRDVGDTCVTDLRLAVNDRVKRDGEWVEEATYIDVCLERYKRYREHAFNVGFDEGADWVWLNQDQMEVQLNV